ncbi:toll/interleukin-1 receptor domain-containing protein [Flavisolibacter nicotianae]|uniref:toll/interleukin-1 receptor domain-containing protein n=1 Tax=Flavisolibacter nicotianae TaxID=2364882 RepID=UPI0013C421BA|nr:toll/interleukin-1 receptor domain-containing protein [Flavisolibacter nicotianae]
MKNASKKIFISYRVQDTAGETGRLVDALKQHFTDDQIFMDIENLEPGADFTVAIENSLDTCDVFLAIIGPHWVGDRDGQPLRINEANDWVRMEVSTALRRNIRVVPVLVDGGTLPKPEQLPPDLQSLLRRQTFEISNRRWRYDTDQLIDFLIKSMGIPPLKAQHTPSSIQEFKKRKTWMYIGAGFILAIVSLAIIGYYMEKDKGPEKAAEQTQSGFQKGVSKTVDEAPATNQSNDPATSNTESETTSNANLAGTWDEVDEGVTSTFVLRQAGNQINLQVEMSGQVISTGTGVVDHNHVELNFTLLGMPTVLKATLSEDGKKLNGTYTIQTTGEAQPVQLKRRL